MTGHTFPRLKNILIEYLRRSQILDVEYVIAIVNANPSLYLYYPYLFSDLFDLEEGETIDKLSIAGFFIYLHTLNHDTLIDTHDKNTIENFPSVLIMNQELQEYVIKILCDIFNDASPFWDLWTERKKAFHSGLVDECNLSAENFTFAAYEKISDKKSAFAKSAIDACYVLSGMKDSPLHALLLASHSCFSLAYQICDDIVDIKKDLLNQQFNYAYFKAKEIGLFQSDQMNDNMTAFYHHAIVSELYEEAILYFRKALAYLPHKHPMGLWHKVILNKIKETEGKLQVLQDFKKIYAYSHTLSSEFTTHVLSGRSISSRLSSAIEKGLTFLLKRVSRDSVQGEAKWEEYVTQAGISTIWASAFIGLQLEPFAQHKRNIASTLHEVRNFVTKSKKDLWSFNEKWGIGDADSSSFALLFIKDSEIEEETIEKWLLFQQSDGGFSTYKNPDELAESLSSSLGAGSYLGWCNSHTCVSAVASHVLWSLKDSYKKQWDKLLHFILKNMHKEGFWNSYWWTGPLYSTYFCAKLLKNLSDHHTLVDTSIEWAISQQNPNGSYSDAFSENCFYTGLALKLLLINDACPHDRLLTSVQYLLDKQFDDGSWSESHALRIPRPDTLLVPDNGYESIKTYGVDTRAREFQRLFTTAVCVNALHSFECNSDLFL